MIDAIRSVLWASAAPRAIGGSAGIVSPTHGAIVHRARAHVRRPERTPHGTCLSPTSTACDTGGVAR